MVATVLKIAVGLGLLIALVLYLDVNALLRSIAQANVFYLIIGSSLVFVNIGLQFIRWRYLVRLVRASMSNKDIIFSLFIGYSTGFFTPGQVGEHGGRMISLPPMQAIQVLAISLIDKIYILAITVIAGLIGAWFYCVIYLPRYWSLWMTMVVIAVVLSFLMVVLYPDMLKKILRVVLHKVRKYRAVSAFLFVKDVFHRRQARVLLVLTIIFYFVVILQYHFFVRAFEPVSLDVSALCTSNIMFIKAVILPISLGDLGIRESTAIFFFSRAGISAASAFNASLCVFFVNIFIPSVTGSVLILRSRSSKPNAAH